MAYKSKIPWTIRIEPELKKRLETIAPKLNRSLNNLIEYFLEYMADYADKAPIRPIDDLLNTFESVMSQGAASKSRSSKTSRSKK